MSVNGRARIRLVIVANLRFVKMVFMAFPHVISEIFLITMDVSLHIWSKHASNGLRPILSATLSPPCLSRDFWRRSLRGTGKCGMWRRTENTLFLRSQDRIYEVFEEK
jgi:hypothetical protein